MNSTQATVIIQAAVQSAAQTDLPGHFRIGYYLATDTADPAIPTHYIDSGWWYNYELAKIANDVLWERQIYFDDLETLLTTLNLKPVNTENL